MLYFIEQLMQIIFKIYLKVKKTLRLVMGT